MRKLNKKQKELLRLHADKLPDDVIPFYKLHNDYTMSLALYEEIRDLNPYETFVQDAENYIFDYMYSKEVSKYYDGI